MTRTPTGTAGGLDGFTDGLEEADLRANNQNDYLQDLVGLIGAGALVIGARRPAGPVRLTLNPVYEKGFVQGVTQQGDVTTATWHTVADQEGARSLYRP